MKTAIAASATLLLATLLWGGLVTAGLGPWATDSAAVLAAGLVVLAAVAIVGMLVGASRWARRLAIGVALCGFALALTIPIDTWWAIGLALSASAIYGLAGNATLGVIRKLPAADGPTPRVVGFTLCLVAIPIVVAALSPGGLGTPEWLVIIAGAITAGVYAKATAMALWAVRSLFPMASLVSAWLTGFPRGLLWAGLAVMVAAAGWTKEVRLGVRPLIKQGRAVPMFPEMVPSEILDAAGLDEKGMRRD